MTGTTWSGVLDASALKAPVVASASRLADAAKNGDWDRVLAAVSGTDRSLTPNDWRPGGASLYTPLHQAAWHGAPLPVVERLIDMGAWRTLRTEKGQRALDIAAEKEHRQLLGILEPVIHRHVDPNSLDRLDLHLAALIETRIRPQIETRLRHPACEVLTEIPEGTLWYPVPGMYGGFNVELREHHLYVESWSRVVGGSGQAHVVTAQGSTLVNEGFV